MIKLGLHSNGAELTGVNHWVYPEINCGPDTRTSPPPGAWNVMEVRMVGPTIQTSVNGVEILHGRLDSGRPAPRRGPGPP